LRKILEIIYLMLIVNNTRCMVEYQQMNNDEVQAKLNELQQKGWTLASIARELGQAIRTVESWNQGKRSPANLQSVLASLDGLLNRKRIPKKKQYKKYRKFSLEQEVEANKKAPSDYKGRKGIITDIRLGGRTTQYGVRFNHEEGKADEGYFDSWMLDPIINTWYCVANAKQWIKAVIFQGRRLLQTHDSGAGKFARLTEEGKLQQIQAEFEQAMEIERIEQYFFIIAVNKAREWLNESAKALPELQPVAKGFNDALPDVKDLRDMREHEIGYFKGDGWKQSEFFRQRRSTLADATATIVNEDDYCIGNRLSVLQAIVVAEQVYPAVVHAFQRLLIQPADF
jgi:transcriptional regulator with XRE-family HTH domain